MINEKDKQHLLHESKTFCMLPWIHVHVSPEGTSGPCCNSPTFIKTTNLSLKELANSDDMKQLRLNMLQGNRSTVCDVCNNCTDSGRKSARDVSNEIWSQEFDAAMMNTESDGSLTDFKMLFFDMRFSNICNFKCRTCTQEFSSQWENENKKSNVPYYRPIPKIVNKPLLSDVIEQIPNMEEAYFAGGEPLIMEEHYILLEEMIKQNCTDIRLRYSTNLSTLKFKDKDLLGLWKHFRRKINVFASIDHYGERAEYIRAGTNWAQVEENLLAFKNINNVQLAGNTVVSVYNCLTFDKFYQYLIDKKILVPGAGTWTTYLMHDPEYLSCDILPTDELKQQAVESIESTIQLLRVNNFAKHQVGMFVNMNFGSNFENIWNEKVEGPDSFITYGQKFKSETMRLDKLRGEDFVKVFPELSTLMDTNT